MEHLDPPVGKPVETSKGGVSISGLGFAYDGTDKDVLSGLDLRCEPDEVVSIVGPSGCGKSTLLSLLTGFCEPSAGVVKVAGARSPQGRLAACAHMPQRDTLLPWYSALDNAALALRNRGAGKRVARRAAAARFERFGLAGFESSRPDELSGGMRQRVSFLRTLLADKPVLLLDEPFGALDAITRAGMQTWLAEALSSEPRTAVLVTHDVEEALFLGDRVAVLSKQPARVVGVLESPRPRDRDRIGAIAEREFVETRRKAMALLQ